MQTECDSANRLRQYQRGVLSSTIVPYRAGPGASITTPISLPGTDQTRTYGLDGLGNWKSTNWTLVGSGGSTTSTAEVRQNNYVNEITSVRDTTDGTATTTPFTYDYGNNANQAQGNGNLTNDGIRTYQWDAFNRLIQVGKVSGSVADVATYVYDALGRRIQKTIANLSGGNGGLTGDIPAGTTSYLYDGQQIVETRDASDAPIAGYFWGQYIDELLVLQTFDGGIARILSDLLYRATATVATYNGIIETYDTDAYGNTLIYSGPGTDGEWFTDDDVRTNNPVNPFIFTGRQYDPETQIYYYRARYYAPEWGRFLQRDPLRFAEIVQGANLYWYVQNNPVNQVDPSGLIAPDCHVLRPLPNRGCNICQWQCTCPSGVLDGFGNTTLTVEADCDSNPESGLSGKCNPRGSYWLTAAELLLAYAAEALAAGAAAVALDH